MNQHYFLKRAEVYVRFEQNVDSNRKENPKRHRETNVHQIETWTNFVWNELNINNYRRCSYSINVKWHTIKDWHNNYHGQADKTDTFALFPIAGILSRSVSLDTVETTPFTRRSKITHGGSYNIPRARLILRSK